MNQNNDVMLMKDRDVFDSKEAEVINLFKQ